MTHTSGSAPRPRQLSITTKTVDAVRIVAVAGEIDHATCPQLTQALLPEDATAVPRTVLDFSGVSFLDSSGLNVLIKAHRTAAAAGGWLRLAGCPDAALRAIELVGLDTLIPCHPDLQHALHA
ncbi:STAS domain-containing protein [Streptomyces minutiscleroticus]|uniref:STAS domain-containing protein n=1 Tax=Streptomyces minutiscleroticus TaxID=68238 RepID=UPI003327F642